MRPAKFQVPFTRFRDEDIAGAALVLACLGDSGGESCTVLANALAAEPGAWFTVEDLERVRRGA